MKSCLVCVTAVIARAQEDHSEDKNVPGYGGYVPGIYAKGVFGATFETAQKEAEALLAPVVLLAVRARSRCRAEKRRPAD